MMNLIISLTTFITCMISFFLISKMLFCLTVFISLFTNSVFKIIWLKVTNTKAKQSFTQLFLFLILILLPCKTSNAQTIVKNDSISQTSVVGEGDKMYNDVYKILLETYGQEKANRLIHGNIAWGDEYEAVMLSHWYEREAAIGHFNVNTPLGKAEEWNFPISDLTCYFINNRLIGIAYPAMKPQWIPKSLAPAISAHSSREEDGSEYDHISSTTDNFVSRIEDFIPSMNSEVKGYYNDAIKGNALAQFKLGACLSDGDGISQNDDEAAYWYMKSAKGGNTWGMFNLAISYSNGDGVKRNDAKAAYWFEKAANKGDIDSQYQLAKLHYNSFFLPHNYAKAIFWFKKVAFSKSSKVKDMKALAYHFLSECYRRGKGVKQNFTISNTYSKRAEALGYYDGLEDEY